MRRALVAAGVLAVLVGATAAHPATTPARSATGSAPAQTWYVTFHGTSSGGSATDQVWAYDAAGSLLQDAVLTRSASGGPELAQLRGMLLGDDGSLFVASGSARNTAVLHYSASVSASTTRDPVPPGGIFAGGVSPIPAGAGLDHPYGLAAAPGSTVVASSQDSQVVTQLSSSGSPVPSGGAASYWAEHYAGTTFPAGTLAPSDTQVHAEDGGLDAPRGVVVSSAAGGAPVLYVADNSAHAVRSYDTGTGKFLGDVLTGKDGLGDPVGLVVRGSLLYVGSEKTDEVMAVDLLHPTAVHHVVPTTLGPATLDAPSGLAFGADGRLYVRSRLGRQVLAYDLDSSGKHATTGSVFLDGLPDTPEQILQVTAASTVGATDPVTPPAGPAPPDASPGAGGAQPVPDVAAPPDADGGAAAGSGTEPRSAAAATTGVPPSTTAHGLAATGPSGALVLGWGGGAAVLVGAGLVRLSGTRGGTSRARRRTSTSRRGPSG